MVLFGPSGSGKTTILRCLAGLDRPQEGFIRFGEEVWFDAAAGINRPPQQRRLAYVSQDYGLFPHLTVEQNIRFGMDAAGAAAHAIASRRSCERSISKGWRRGSQPNCREESGSAWRWHARWREIRG